MEDKIIFALISGFVGAVVAYLGAILKDIVDTRTFIDKDLLNKRADLYQSAWEKTELLSKYCGKDDATIEQYGKLSEDLHNWYFQNGGLYLSRNSQKAFANLQTALIELPKDGISNESRKNTRNLGSLFRTELTNDILSRRSARKL